MEADQKAMELLRDHHDQLEKIARGLLEREELSEVEITELIGPSIHVRKGEREDMVEQILAPESAAEHSPGPV